MRGLRLWIRGSGLVFVGSRLKPSGSAYVATSAASGSGSIVRVSPDSRCRCADRSNPVEVDVRQANPERANSRVEPLIGRDRRSLQDIAIFRHGEVCGIAAPILERDLVWKPAQNEPSWLVSTIRPCSSTHPRESAARSANEPARRAPCRAGCRASACIAVSNTAAVADDEQRLGAHIEPNLLRTHGLRGRTPGTYSACRSSAVR